MNALFMSAGRKLILSPVSNRLAPIEQIWEESNRTPVLIFQRGYHSAGCNWQDWWFDQTVLFSGFLLPFPCPLCCCFSAPLDGRQLIGSRFCALLAEEFSSLPPSLLRLSFEILALSGCGLFVGELIRNRRLTMQVEARLKALVETSPAAIVTVDEHGFIELANQAAIELLAPRDRSLLKAPIAAFLPELHHARCAGKRPRNSRASMRCQGHKANGEWFAADVWFSTYKEGNIPKLAAIIADLSEDDSADSGTHAIRKRKSGIFLVPGNWKCFVCSCRVLANKEIAAWMKISESAVKNTLQQLFAKTGVRTQASASS